MLNAVTATSQTTAASGESAAARTQIAETYDDFLQLLVTQLQNQDPISPMDSTEFTNQLVSFTQVEQQINTNESLDELIALMGDSALGRPLDYLGHNVEVLGGTFSYTGTPVEMSYGASDGVSNVVVRVVNAAGTTVYQADGDAAPGRHDITWDGTTTDGDDVPPGTYGLVVTATDADGLPVALPTSTLGRVTGVETLDGETRLLVGNVAVGEDEIIAVRSSTAGNG